MVWSKEPIVIQGKEYLNRKFKKGNYRSLLSNRKKQFCINIKYTPYILSAILSLLLACEEKDPKYYAMQKEREAQDKKFEFTHKAEEYKNEGYDCILKGDYSGAISKFTKAIDNAENAGRDLGYGIVSDCLGRRGEAYYKLNQHDNAVEDYTKAIEMRNYKYKERGLAFYAKGDYEKAISDFNSELKYWPGSGIALYYRAKSYESLGNKRQAMKDYKAAAEEGFSEAMDLLHSRGINFDSPYKRNWERARGISSPESRSSSARSSCYDLGYRWGSCAAKAIAGLSCPPGDDFEMPVECRGKAETQRGAIAGTRAVMR